ncbi:hypothetical protein GCM10007881_62880 [Mesorhizobium huakuii]|uniref:hypothetical protein n=1 Tax=Mesorhizobium huakuii TaxID=28104 RepID=UPI00235BCABB|nr:hypothetical protein [Mesorhizobium huakuii]GLQ82765.1 hypothetical protein GCM10007881_62880 [Mesorhizobium huakuii]
MRKAISVGALFTLCMMSGSAWGQGITLPWGQSSDMIAWEEFVQVVAPSGNQNVQKVEFETWASDEDIYEKSPAQWPTVDAPKVLQVSALGASRAEGMAKFVFIVGNCSPPGGLTRPKDAPVAAGSGFPASGCIGEEVRRNWASFQYIVSNGLDSRSGLKRAFASNFKVDLPSDAIEFKGDWASVDDVAKWLSIDRGKVEDNYYINTVYDGKSKVEFALLSFHISTKQIKNWVWSDFEGSLNPGRCDVIGCRDSFGAEKPLVVPNKAPWQSYGGCEKTKPVLAMFENSGIGAVWQRYCLKGTQVTFTDDSGNPTLLGNSVIEPLDAAVPMNRSSCISCHGYASFNANGGANSSVLDDNLIGEIDKERMKGYLSNDFIWGNFLRNLKN